MTGDLALGPPRSDRTTSRRQPRRLLSVAAAVAAALLLSGLVPIAGPAPTRVLAEDQDPFLAIMRFLAFDEGKVLVVSPDGVVTDEDLFGDVDGANTGYNDLGQGGYAFLPTVPPWLLAAFGCTKETVACPATGSDDAAFAEGAYVFYLRLSAPPDSVAPGERLELGPMFALDRYPPNPLAPGQAFSGASHAVITRRDGTKREVIYFAYTSGSFQVYKTNARSMWVDRDFLTIIPKAKEVLTMPVGWDVYAYRSDGTPAGTGRDTIRGFTGAALLPFTGPPTIEFADAPAVSPSPTPVVEASPSPSATPGLTPSPAPTGGGTQAGSSFIADLVNNLLAQFLVGLAILLIGVWLFVNRRRDQQPPPATPREPRPTDPAPPTPPTPAPPPPAPAPPVDHPSGPVIRGGGGGAPIPPGPVPPGPVPPAPDSPCKDGDEEWRGDKPAATFLVPPADGKVHIAADPSTPALEAWIAAFAFPTGAPFDQFVGIDDHELDDLLAGFPDGGTEVHWKLEFELDEYRLECQRKWVCRAGVYVPTKETRVDESGPDPYAGRYVVDGPDRSVEDVRKIWRDARTALNGAESNVAAMDRYRSAC